MSVTLSTHLWHPHSEDIIPHQVVPWFFVHQLSAQKVYHRQDLQEFNIAYKVFSYYTIGTFAKKFHHHLIQSNTWNHMQFVTWDATSHLIITLIQLERPHACPEEGAPWHFILVETMSLAWLLTIKYSPQVLHTLRGMHKLQEPLILPAPPAQGLSELHLVSSRQWHLCLWLERKHSYPYNN